MRRKKKLVPIIWLVLACFFLSLDGVRVFGFEILDSPGTQDTLPTGTDPSGSGADDAPADPAAGTGDTADPDAPPADEVAPEPLSMPENADECVLVDRFEWYNIPAGELSADDDRSGPCGPYSTTSALKGRGKKTTYAEVLKVLKPQDCYTVPGEIVDYLIDQDVSCRRHDNASIDQILNIIKTDKRSVICIVHTSELEADGDSFKVTENGLQHWVNIVGLRVRDDKPVSVLMKDSYWSHGSGRIKEMPANEFDYRWKEMKGIYALGINTKRMLLAIGALGSADFGDRLAAYLQYMFAGEVLAGGIATGYKALGAMWSGFQEFVFTGNPTALLTAATQLVGSVGKIVAGLAGWCVYQIGNGIEAGGKFLSDTAHDLWKNGGILGKVAAIPMAVLGTALQLVGGVIKTIGNLVASVAETIGNVISDIADAIGKFFEKLGEALNPTNWF